MGEETMSNETIQTLKLGPDGYTGIAILGTAGTSMSLAPFKDPAWAIWACSPGTYPICAQNRSDVFFEVHRWQPTPPGKLGSPGTKPWFSPEFHTFLREHKGPVFMAEKQTDIPSSVRIPFEALIEKYGPYFWTSSVAYMIAMAIEALQDRAAAGEKVAIGMWGVDMAASEEYAYQRPGCQHFLGLAMSLGINVVLQPESDLMRPPTMYGIGELNQRHIRLMARRAEAQAQHDALIAQHDQIIKQTMLAKGVLQEIDYMLSTWTDDIHPDPAKAVSFSQEFVQPVGRFAAAVREAQAIESTGADVTELKGAKAV